MHQSIHTHVGVDVSTAKIASRTNECNVCTNTLKLDSDKQLSIHKALKTDAQTTARHCTTTPRRSNVAKTPSDGCAKRRDTYMNPYTTCANESDTTTNTHRDTNANERNEN